MCSATILRCEEKKEKKEGQALEEGGSGLYFIVFSIPPWL